MLQIFLLLQSDLIDGERPRHSSSESCQNFDGKFDPVPFSWRDIKNITQRWDDAIADSGWVSIFLDNHDFPRMVSRFGNDKKYRVESSKLLAMMILTLRGTPCIYQGSEIGMTNVQFESIDDYRDVEIFNVQKEYLARGTTQDEFLSLVHEAGRDNVRTPMQWNDSAHAGFTIGTPWIKVNPNYNTINVETALRDKNSIFYFYKSLLAYRKKHMTLTYGVFREHKSTSENLYVYSREGAESFIIILNHSDEHTAHDQPLKGYALEIRNMENDMEAVLLPWEARLYRKTTSNT